jgi:hypothetical protein
MANDFSQDTRCKALWRLESGALTVDSKGNNTLTPINSPGEDTVDYREGACCSTHDKTINQRLYRPDAGLDAGFPLKSGDSVKKISFCCWYKPTTTNSYCVVTGKKDWANSKVSLALCVRDSGQAFISWGYQAGQYERYLNLGNLTAGRWYHFGVVADGKAKTLHVRVYDVTGNTATNYNGTFAEEIYVTDVPWSIGGSQGGTDPLDGKVDEVVVFNDLLSDSEIDYIRNGTFPPPPFVQVDATGVLAVYDSQPAVKIDATGIMVVYSTVPEFLPPANSASRTTCEALQLAPGSCKSLTTCEEISLPKLGNCRALTTCANLAGGGPEKSVSSGECPGIPLSHAGLFLMF